MKSFFIELSGKIINTTIPLILLMFSGSVSAQTISVKEVSGYTRNHVRKDTINVNYYIDNKGLERKPYVQFANTVPSLISREYSEVQIWRNNGVITNCIDWKRISNIVPGDGSPYLAFQNYDGCRFNIPDYNKSGSPNRIDAQINYRIGYAVVGNNGINKGGPWQLSYRKVGSGSFRCYPSGKVASTNDCKSVTLKYGSIKFNEESSINYRIFWCGDGLLNGPNGSSKYDNGSFTEECDPNDPSKKNWGPGGCDCNCKRIIHDNTITSNKTTAKPASTSTDNAKSNANSTVARPASTAQTTARPASTSNNNPKTDENLSNSMKKEKKESVSVSAEEVVAGAILGYLGWVINTTVSQYKSAKDLPYEPPKSTDNIHNVTENNISQYISRIEISSESYGKTHYWVTYSDGTKGRIMYDSNKGQWNYDMGTSAFFYQSTSSKQRALYLTYKNNK